MLPLNFQVCCEGVTAEKVSKQTDHSRGTTALLGAGKAGFPFDTVHKRCVAIGRTAQHTNAIQIALTSNPEEEDFR